MDDGEGRGVEVEVRGGDVIVLPVCQFLALSDAIVTRCLADQRWLCVGRCKPLLH